MPLKLVPPKAGRSTFWRVRGTYLGVYVYRSTQTGDRKVAGRLLACWKEEIERGAYARPGDPTFASAATSYMQAGGEKRFLAPVIKHFGLKLLADVDQAAVDEAATTIYPESTPATRNRQVYTPVLAVLAHAGVMIRLKRPKGAQGAARTAFLDPAEAHRLRRAARARDPELGAFITLCLYTGLRLSEALGLRCDDLNLSERRAFCGCTKNGDPRTVHLPPVVVAALADHPRGLDRAGERVFAWTKGRPFHTLVMTVYRRAKVDARGAPIHILRHTYATWMRRYAGADERDLLDTGAWRDRGSVARYTHTQVSEAARLADKLPTRASDVRNGAI